MKTQKTNHNLVQNSLSIRSPLSLSLTLFLSPLSPLPVHPPRLLHPESETVIVASFAIVKDDMDPPTSWDSLRKQARKLVAQLDEQMHLYRRQVSARVDDVKDSELESCIEALLKQLQQVNSQMQSWVSSGGSEIVSHTLTRHQGLLHDISQEFYRLRSSLKAKKEHASLLDNFREFDRARADLEDGGSAGQTLLKEHASISRSTGQMDNVISQAQATLGALVFQRSTVGGIDLKLSNIGSRLPTVNNILSSIKRKKSMDTIILSLVASVCTFLILIYWLNK